MSLVIIFFFVSVIALVSMRGLRINERVDIYSRGAGQPELLLMIWVFLLAGAFSSTARQMGAIDAVVNATLSVLPTSMVLPGLFLASCVVSFSIGTSVGTIAALVPLASAMAAPVGVSVPMMVGCVVGGSFFGDNLSFISDTTIVATRTQGVQLRDKFLANFRLVLPTALIILAFYVVYGLVSGAGHSALGQPITLTQLTLLLPYVSVIVLALAGLNVLVVLLLGNLFAGLVGLSLGRLESGDWADAVSAGMAGMQETILVALMAGGLLAVVRHQGAMDWIIRHLMRHARSKRGAEYAIAALVSVTNFLTANNTVAILSVGGVVSDIADTYNIDKRRSASLLDTFSCVVQGLLPYGAQVLIAAGLASIPTLAILPCLYYNFLLGLVALIYIAVQPHRSVK